MDIGATVQSAVWKKAVSSIFKISIKQRPGTLVLDPLSVILVLAINAFKPIGTKLYFGNGILELHDAGFLQSTVRAWCGESKANIRLLNNPIIYACKQFFQHQHRTQDIQFLFTNAVHGLENLRHTYREDRDIIAYLNSYINIIVTTMDTTSGTSAEVLDLLLKLKLTDVAIANIDHDHDHDVTNPITIPSLSHHTYTTPTQPVSVSPSSVSSSPSQPQPVSSSNVTQRTTCLNKDKPAPTPAPTPAPLAYRPIESQPPQTYTHSTQQQYITNTAVLLKANLFVELQRAWNPNKIATMIGLLKELDVATPFSQKHIFVALDAFLMCIHEKTKLTIETLFDIK